MSANLSVKPRGRNPRSMRIGTNGAGGYWAQMLIAGYSISNEVDPVQAKKVRQHWLSYRGRNRTDLWDLTARERAIQAIQDDTDDLSWVEIRDLDRKRLDKLDCRHLRALVMLYHVATTLWDWHPELRLTRELIDAVEIATRALEEAGSCWAEKCREAANLLAHAGPEARFTVG